MVQLVVLFAAGGLVGAALDHLHVAFGVLDYPHPFLFDQAIWVPALFGAATVSFVGTWVLAFRHRDEPRHGARDLPVATLLFAATYLVTCLGRSQPELLLAALTISWLVLAGRDAGRGRLLTFGLVIAIFGVLFEAGLSQLGGFHYRVPVLGSLLPVPLWLPGLYLHASLLARPVAQRAFGAPGP